MIYQASNGLELEMVLNRKNNKNIYFRIKEDLKLYVNAPLFLSKDSILKLIQENEENILKMYNKMANKTIENDKFWYLGKSYIINFIDSGDIFFKDENVYTISLEQLDKFYQSQVIKIFTQEVEIAKKCFSKLPEFTLKFRKMRTRWGVCNTFKKTITLNTELLKKDIELLDYVIIHELCHFFEGNHSKNFWKLVEQAYPNYKEARKKLRY